VVEQRGLTLASDEKDRYVGMLRRLARSATGEHFLDRLLIAGVIEARGCERLNLVADALPEGDLKDLYLDLARAEARHHGLFVRLAKLCFDAEVVRERLDELLEAEAAIVAQLPLRAAVH
jgi:tRNA-(ms[2]io[6]A)-hydroxylase